MTIEVMIRTCICCQGRAGNTACEECDGTGKKWTLIDDGFRATGSGDPSPETIEAMHGLHQAALDYISEHRP